MHLKAYKKYIKNKLLLLVMLIKVVLLLLVGSLSMLTTPVC